MSDFDERRAAVASARQDRDAAFEAVALELARSRGEGGEEAVAAARERLKGARAVEREAFAAFTEVSDPRRRLGELSTALPILLLPLRLETRFMTVGDGERELWVRAYPSSALIDTFEPLLSDSELRTGREYWQDVWRAGGVEADERAAWRDLVAAHGSGRAGFVADAAAPVNPGDAPTRATEADIALVAATESAAPAEHAVLAAYWTAFWQADGDPTAEQAARAELETHVTPARADELIAAYRPFNLDDHAGDRAGRAVTVAFLQFAPAPPTTASSWTRGPKVDVLPDRLVAIAFSGPDTIEALGAGVPSPLYAGIDPSAPPEEQFTRADGDLEFPDQLRWMTDFEAAVDAGMAFRLPLTAEQAERGIDRLFVVGVRLTADGKELVERLVQDHQRGRSGFALVPQGTPTNNTESESSGHGRREDADVTFDERRRGDLFTPSEDWREQRDGQRLADLLGIDPAVLQRVSRSDGTDQREARAMNVALWPATGGYFMETLMAPVFSDADIEDTRAFFTALVSGRGALPAVRIGNEPWGILATTAFSRLALPEEGERRPGYPRRLLALLDRIDGDWAAMAAGVAHVGADGDPHQILLDILGLHPASAEFHARYARGVRHLYNHALFVGLGGAFDEAIEEAPGPRAARAVLARLGYRGDAVPTLFSRYLHRGQHPLDGPVIDDRALSESDPVRIWTADGARNYLRWLIDSARTSLELLRIESGFADDTPPTALLYLLARHALMLGFHDASYRLHSTHGVFDGARLRALRDDPELVHVADRDAREGVSESRWQALYKAEPLITGSSSRLVANHIVDVLAESADTARLREQIEALELLAGVPTARLERALAEHLDCVSYRLDAWLLAFVRARLEAMRAQGGEGEGETVRRGVHLGAYGWLEDVRPQRRSLEPVQLDAELAGIFQRPGEAPLLRDSANGGYVHAPSLDHATTVSVLRSGYLANRSSETDALAVDLSSRRVRLALQLLDGIRSGQSLGALLGYRLERGLHDRHAVAEVDRFVFALRKAFPLRADRLDDTQTDPGVPIEAIEARNVVDGLRLVEHVRTTGNDRYPFGRSLPSASDAQREAIDAEVAALLDVHDAVADLALAEGVHQAVRGNYDRVAGTLEAYTKGGFPPEPEVVRTPTEGLALTHRLALHLTPGLGAPAVHPTPRATAEPALNAWLAGMLPPLNTVCCTVTWTDPVTTTGDQRIVTVDDLGLQPLDLVRLVQPDTEQAMAELDDRVLAHVIADADPRPDATLTISYRERHTGRVPLFEVAPLVRSLAELVLRSRPLRPGDTIPAGTATEQADAQLQIDPGRITAVKSALDTLGTDIAAFLAAQPATPQTIVTAIDTTVADAAALLARAASFGIPQTGFGFALDGKRVRFAAVMERVRARLERWDAKLDEAQDGLDADAALPPTTPDDERIKRLRATELVVSTTPSPPPANPDALRAAVIAARDGLAALRGQLQAIADTPSSSLSALLAAIDALLPFTAFDAEPFTLAEDTDAVVALAADIVAAITRSGTTVADRGTAAQDHITGGALEDAARALLGEDFQIIPEFTLDATNDAEVQNAVGATGDLLRHLHDDLGIDFPVDEWLYGIARVREKAASWERAGLLAGGFGVTEPELTPLQLPFRADDRWLALQFPPTADLTGERLLYTAHFATPPAAGGPYCGLLLDEWTEVLPAEQQTTGVAVHYDRPNAEAPQTWLLVTPATSKGVWEWSELVAALGDTLDLARRRAVEPAQIDASPYAYFLPATWLAGSLRGLTPGTLLVRNIDAIARITGVADA